MSAPAAFAAASLSMPSLGAGIRLPPASSLCGRSSKARLLTCPSLNTRHDTSDPFGACCQVESIVNTLR